MNDYRENYTREVYTSFQPSEQGLEWYLLMGFLLAVSTGDSVTGVMIFQQHPHLIIQIQGQHHIQYQILAYFLLRWNKNIISPFIC